MTRKKKSAFKMGGMSFKQEQSPIKSVEQAFKVGPPNSSREALIEISQRFTSTPNPIDIDYGGGFDVSDASFSTKKKKKKKKENGEDPNLEPVKEIKPPKKKLNWGFLRKMFKSGGKKPSIKVGKPVGKILKD